MRVPSFSDVDYGFGEGIHNVHFCFYIGSLPYQDFGTWKNSYNNKKFQILELENAISAKIT